jgi:hypothetical protein
MEQIRLRTLLSKDKFYKAWFSKPPTLKVLHHTPPWRVYVRKEQQGSWARVDVEAFGKAHNEIVRRLPDYWDFALHSKCQAFLPPVLKAGGKHVWLPMPDGHNWCEYCRRPTVFKFFKRHPAIRQVINPDDLRCGICGARLQSMHKIKTPLTWPAGAT